jgi:hypothetical protein
MADTTRNLRTSVLLALLLNRSASCSEMPYVSEPSTGCVALPKPRSKISLVAATRKPGSRPWWPSGSGIPDPCYLTPKHGDWPVLRYSPIQEHEERNGYA